jgi:multiple antibiotic resistance protein
MTVLFTAILAKAFQLFLVLDPIGNTGIIATLIAGFTKERQRRILYRELTFALIILVVMLFLGSYLLTSLGLSQAAVTITGGIIFFLFSLSLLFPGSSVVSLKNLSEEPFFVPIATPLIVGPSSTATVILFSHDPSMAWPSSLAAVIIAWVATAIIVLLGPMLLSKVGKVGMMVAERMIGMICALIAVKMVLKGLKLFLASI